jgi:hypothetical protein
LNCKGEHGVEKDIYLKLLGKVIMTMLMNWVSFGIYDKK